MKLIPTKNDERSVRTLAALAMACLMVAVPACGVPAAAAQPTDRGAPAPIVGGAPVADGQYPFMTALLTTADDKQFCGGTLYDAATILTAAHCVEGMTASDLRVAVGRTLLSNAGQGQERDVALITIHPQWRSDPALPFANDIALLALARPVRGVQPVTMPTAGADALLGPGTRAKVIGWGATTPGADDGPDRLFGVDVPILDSDECTAAVPGFDTVTELCAGVRGKDSCQGDSGGPLFKTVNGRVYQIGIVSLGNGCARQGNPGVYTSLSSETMWKSFLPGEK